MTKVPPGRRGARTQDGAGSTKLQRDTERVDICTAQAADAPGGDKECPDDPCACEREGEADGYASGALAVNAIITRFWGREATL